ncbi:uncharacterized protein [Phaseolus vulgaris]|uniref:uncharacterized protein n=1 Tax=Phaseolus vulgaris TaxID=3885 RepID=UPI0035C9BDE8
MDRSWINTSRISDTYEKGVEEFIQFAEHNAVSYKNGVRIRCPCINCLNGRILSVSEIREHLLCDGFLKSYTTWTWHGELLDLPSVHGGSEEVHFSMDDRLEDMIRDVGAESFANVVFENMSNDAETPLYPGSTNSKVVWYLPIIPRLKRLFANADDAKNLRWHADNRKCDGLLRHSADSLQWKNIDKEFPEFGKESRNLRLGLATDGMNPFGNLSSNHSSWPVLLVIYNLPPALCMKRKYMMLSMMISGPKQPGNDIDVYLNPLIEDLKLLWNEGVDVFDAFKNESFRLHAMLFCTINDFPAYGNLSGYSVKGHRACPICQDKTSYEQLKHGRKTVYLGHRRFLKKYHPYRRLKKAFNGYQEHDICPTPLSGVEIYEKIKNVNVTFGKMKKKQTVSEIWKKRSIFFDLPYWCKLDVRHCLDVMHVEKNVCDSLIGTLLNIKGKTKDGVNARLDLIEMNIREELAPREVGKRTYLPAACYTLSKKEKTSFCECLKGVKVPQGYSSNVKSLVSMNALKLIGLKSHDCHVLMQQLLPVAIRGILPKNVRHTITRLCSFFNSICSKEIDSQKLDELEEEIIVILCQLEMFFPPSFFDIMVHLVVHLVREIRLCGPVYMRWMYLVERYMKILKGYVKNQCRPEASIIERYISEESIEFCSEYMSKAKCIGVPEKAWHSRRFISKSSRGVHVISKSREEVLQAHLYILNNTDEVLPYLDTHKDIVKYKNPRQSEKWVLIEHNKTFMSWFKQQIMNDPSASETLTWLANGLKFDVLCCSGYEVNGCLFYTKSRDDRSTVQNSGVTLEAESMQFSTAKDQNPVVGSMPYYGVIVEIWEVNYTKFTVPVFKCKWVDNKTGVKVDESGMTLVDFRKIGYHDEPFIMAHQASQVFYIQDPTSDHWSVVLHGKKQHNDPEDTNNDICEIESLTRTTINKEYEDVADVVHATRNDHDEGIYICMYYLGVLSRERISILTQSWDHVTDHEKNMIWQDILTHYNIPNVETLKAKVLSDVGVKFRQFKSKLTTDYIYGKRKEENPCAKYASIDEETWQQFVNIRQTEKWQEVRNKAKANQAHNDTPHLLSRGGYKLLEQRMLEEKIKARSTSIEEMNSVDSLRPPSPPLRHEMWKGARINTLGTWSSKSTEETVERIDSLNEQSTQGTFKPCGCNDILNVALGRPEHPGRVRVAGYGVGIRSYFGPPSHSKEQLSNEPSQEYLLQLREQLKAEVTQELKESFMEEFSARMEMEFKKRLEGLGHSQQPPTMVEDEPPPPPIKKVSTKGSCSAIDLSGDDFGSTSQCELYVECNSSTRFVALGKCYEGVTMLHNVPLSSNLMKVTVEKVLYGDLAVPVPTSEVTIVAEALHTFVAWPRHLVRPIDSMQEPKTNLPLGKKKIVSIDDPLAALVEVATALDTTVLEVPWDANVFGRHSNLPLYVHMSDLLDLASGDQEINITVLQLWMMYLSGLCFDEGKHNIYGFLDPQITQSIGNKKSETQTYITTALKNGGKHIYFAPYIHERHWQLLIISVQDHTAAWFCSLHKKPPAYFKNIIDSAYSGYNMLCGRRTSNAQKLTWMYLKVFKVYLFT